VTRILLVDDNGEVRRSMRAMLAELVADVTFEDAADAAGALAALARDPWDLVLLDLSLPDRSGLETLRQIRGIRPAVPVLVMSFNAQAEYAAATRAAGAVGYIAKGSSLDVIASAVRSALAPASLQK
jgi:two-component system, NarL family, invasion response regulator UvrY